MLAQVNVSLVLSASESFIPRSQNQFKMNKGMMSLCLLAAVAFIDLVPPTAASPKANIQVLTKEISVENKDRSGDSRCASCTSDCPTTCGPPITYPPVTYPPVTYPPVTVPPCHDCECPPANKPPTSKYPNLPSVTYSTNCDFCEHTIYTLTCVESPFDCASRCAVDMRCSHFTYIANLKGGTCILKNAFGSGGAWASPVPSPSPYVCGYIPSRALIGIFLNICVGLDITGTVR